jgi:beta-lactamase class A
VAPPLQVNWVAGLIFIFACALSTPSAAAQSNPTPDPACGAIPDDTDALQWEYVPPTSGPAHLLCVAGNLGDAVSASRGTWGVAVRDFSTGESLLINPDRSFIAGSLYKLGVAAEAYARISEGTLSEDSYVAVSPEDVSPEYGGSRYASGTYLTIHDALLAMLTESDNGAALATIDRLGLAAVNQRFVDLGMPNTRLMYDAESTPRDLLTYFSLLADSELITPEVSDSILNLLSAQQINYLIPDGLPVDEDWRMAHKTGNIDAMLGDAGIVFAPHEVFALVILNNDLVSYGASINTFHAIAARVYASLVPPEPSSLILQKGVG